MPANTILFSSDIDDPAPWRETLAQARPDLEFRVWPDIGDAGDVRYGLIWRAPEGVLKSLPNLEAIFALGAGVDQILRDPQFPKEIPLFRLVDAGLREQMTEYVIYGVLHWHRRFGQYMAQQKVHEWCMLDAVHPSQRTVGVMGLGVFGTDAAAKLAGLGFRVIGWSRTPKSIEGIQCYSGPAERDEFLGRSEILVNLLPLTGETRGILNANLFSRLPKGAALIHLGRGGHLVENDLLAAIESGQVGWAMLDVFPSEPLGPDHPFWDNPSILVTPHVAAQPVSEIAKEQLLANLARFEAGEEPLGRVDPSVGY